MLRATFAFAEDNRNFLVYLLINRTLKYLDGRVKSVVSLAERMQILVLVLTCPEEPFFFLGNNDRAARAK